MGLALFLVGLVAGQEGAAWDVTLARGDAYTVEFTTDEGTFMSVDVSPDGEMLVFDLLAHVYRVPAAGGAAECLTADSGVALNYHPRYSPDGESIAFVSDRGGQNNLWIMDADGGNPRQVFDEPMVRVVEPVWTPDGDYIIVRRQSLDTPRSSGLWMYHRNGGEGVELVGDDVSRASWPTLSPDGRYLYFQFSPSPERDLIRGAYQIDRLDRVTGERSEVTAGEMQQQYQGSSGGAIAPQASPDGRFIAFARRMPDATISYKGHRYGPRTALWLRDLETGSERLLLDPIEMDVAEGMKTLRVLPGYGWSKDSRSIFLSRGGKLAKLDVATGAVSPVPFTAEVRRPVSEMAYGKTSVASDNFDVRFTRWPAVSPDGRTLVFNAAGKLWRMALPDGTPTRLTPDGFSSFELSPAFSPDGSTIAFTTWEDTEGDVFRVPASGGAPQKLSARSAEYLHPVWTPDGSALVVVRGSGATQRGRSWSNNLWYELVRLPATGEEAEAELEAETEVILRTKRPFNEGRPLMPRRQIVAPSFGPEGRLFFPEQIGVRENGRTEERTELVSVKLDGSDRRVHMTFPYADEAVPSPDGKWVAFSDELGSIETGKLGDLVVLAGNPLDDIRQTANIVYVMKDGVVYDGDTLDEVWPEPAPYGAYPWLVPGIYETGDHPW